MTTFFMSTWWGDSKNIEEIEFSRWLFEGRPRQGKNVLPDGLNWLCYLAGSSKSHCENSISCIFLESPHQVDMKNVVKCYKHFFCYFNALKTNCALGYVARNISRHYILHFLLLRLKYIGYFVFKLEDINPHPFILNTKLPIYINL